MSSIIVFLLITCACMAFFAEPHKSGACPVIFIVSNGMNVTTPSEQEIVSMGITLMPDLDVANPLFDADGNGTMYLHLVESRFTDCVTVIPVRVQIVNKLIVRLANSYMVRECKRRFRRESCIVLTQHTDWFNQTTTPLPVVSSVFALETLVSKIEVRIVRDEVTGQPFRDFVWAGR